MSNNSGDLQYVRRQRLFLPQVASLILGLQLYHSFHWINTQTVKFYVENNSMKDFMGLIESDIIWLLYIAFSVCIRMQTNIKLIY